MSFLNRIFGRGDKTSGSDALAAVAEAEYKGFTIRATPRKEQGQYLVAGLIEKVVGGVPKQHTFVRADRSPNLDEITEMALTKGRLMIDQQGDDLFRS